MEDSLRDLPVEEWPSLISMYGIDVEHGLTARVTVWSQVYQRGRFPDFPIRMLVPYGDKTEGLVVVFVPCQGVPNLEISILSPKKNPDRLFRALRETKSIDYTRPILFCSVIPKLQQPLYDLLDDMNYEHHHTATHISCIAAEKVAAFKIELPAGLEIRALDKRFAPLIGANWPHGYPKVERYFELLIQYDMGVGLYGDDHPDDLRGWIFINVRGDMHSLFVLEKHRNKGYARFLVKHMSKRLAGNGYEVFACVRVENEASLGVFKSMGFEFPFAVKWVTKK